MVISENFILVPECIPWDERILPIGIVQHKLYNQLLLGKSDIIVLLIN